MIRWLWLAVFLASSAFAQTAWHIPNADVRFELEIAGNPSAPCAGVIAFLPDGGLLPRPTADVVVVDDAGTELKSGCLWHNPREGYAVIFEKPSSSRAWAYLRPGSRPTVPSDFCPSLLLSTQTGNAGLETARQLAADNHNARAGLVDRIGHMENLFGADDHYSSCYTGFLNIPKAGRYYFATISDEGSAVRIDGKDVVTWSGLHARDGGNKGQRGDSVTLAVGVHRLEYFQFDQTGPQEAHLVWRQPNDKPDALPQTVPEEMFVHSGTARVKSATSREGAMLAAFTFACESYLWLGEQPVNLFRLRALTEGTWNLGDGRQLTGQDITWLIEGSDAKEITFTAGKSASSRAVYFDRPPGRSSINHQGQRREYRAALLQRCRAVAPPKRPCADWSADLWATLFGVIEPHEGQELLEQIFERSRADVLALKKDDRWRLEDVYFDLLRENDPNRALPWIERFLHDEQDNARRFDWQLARVELTLYELNDPAKAKKLADGLRDLATGAGTDAASRLLVRQGDIERVSGKVDVARRFYAAAQERGPGAKKDWRAAAVRQAAYYEEVRNLVDQHALEEAHDLMRKWEVELPLSKLEGDYTLAEAEYWIAANQRARAVRLLQAFRQQTDVSPFLPKAMELERDCLYALGKRTELAALVADIQKRFPTLPLAKESAQLLEDARRPADETLP